METAVRELEAADEFLFDSVEQAHVDRWHQGRVVLVGDAAWCVTLYAGMGATSGLVGAEALGQMLQKHPDDLEQALTAWEDKLRPAIAEFQKSAGPMRVIFTQGSRREQLRQNATIGLRRLILRSRALSGDPHPLQDVQVAQRRLGGLIMCT